MAAYMQQWTNITKYYVRSFMFYLCQPYEADITICCSVKPEKLQEKLLKANVTFTFNIFYDLYMLCGIQRRHLYHTVYSVKLNIFNIFTYETK